MSVVQKIQELKAPVEESSMEQIGLMIKADREYKKLLAARILVKPERQVASSLEMSTGCFNYNQGH
jgi:hypothetical protein